MDMMSNGGSSPMGGDAMENMPQPELPQDQQDLPDQPETMDDDSDNDHIEGLVNFALSEMNIAKKLKNKKVKDTDQPLIEQMATDVMKGIDDDIESRKGWLDKNREWLRMALLVREQKSWPWPNASNIKYPLLATAAMQFSARAYPALVPSDGKVVKAKVIPYDPDGELAKKAERIARHMSYQVMCKIPDWEEEMDKLLMTMAISGVCFKKTYHNSMLNQHISQIVYPENFIVNYYAKSLEHAYRKTEVLYFRDNEIKEKVANDEEFLDIEYGTPEKIEDTDADEVNVTDVRNGGTVDGSTPHMFYACHTYYDLDGDGYEEPYIITIHKSTKKIVKIIARWDQDGVIKGSKDKIVSIQPVEYFTAYPFIPNPDGSIYSLGFGLLLGPLNESVNSVINQLVDAGTLNNMQSGFIGKGLRLKMGANSIEPGKWLAVNATGDDLKKQIVPLPAKEPSPVLMNLLQMLITSGNQLASIAEIFVGKMPGQNTPATTTQETVKQGMAVFTAIYKRVYRSLHSEFKKLYRLNAITPGTVDDEARVLGIQGLKQSDYDDDNYIVPGGDPTGDSESTKLTKVQYVMSLIQLGTLDPMAVTEWALESQEIPGFQKLLAKPQPPKPDPKMETEKMKQQTMQMKASSDQQLAQQKLQLEEAMAELKIQLEQKKLEFEQTKQAMDIQGKQNEMHMDQITQANQMQMDQVQMQHDAMANQAKTKMDLEATQQMHKQKIQQGEESFKQKQTQQKATQAAKPTPKKGV